VIWLYINNKRRTSFQQNSIQPGPYKVIKVHGATITAQRHSHQITRNISYFRRLNLGEKERQYHLDDQQSDEEEDEIVRNEQDQEDARRYPASLQGIDNEQTFIMIRTRQFSVINL
jgi:hypothetical protein